MFHKSIHRSAIAVVAAACLIPVIAKAGPVTYTFQQGASGYTGAEDNNIAGDNRGPEPTNNKGAATIMSIYEREVSLNNFYRGILRFDISSIAPVTSVQSASLTLTLNNAGGVQGVTNFLYQISAANKDWVEGTQTNGPEAGSSTWNMKNASPWAGSAGLSTAVADYFATPLGSAASPTINGNSMTINFSNPSFLLDWIANPANNAGFFLRQGDGTDSVDSFYTSEFSTVAFRPLLSITMAPVPPVIPEPSTFALLGMGLTGMAWQARRRRRVAV